MLKDIYFSQESFDITHNFDSPYYDSCQPVNMIKIDGEYVLYNEIIDNGHEPMTQFKDLKLVATMDDSEMELKHLPKEEYFKMKRKELQRVISTYLARTLNYNVVISVNGCGAKAIQGSRLFINRDEIRIGEVIEDSWIHNFPCVIEEVFVVDKTKTMFIALTEHEVDEEDEEYIIDPSCYASDDL